MPHARAESRHARTTSVDSKASRHSLLGWLKKAGGHNRSQSLDQQIVGAPWQRAHQRTRSTEVVNAPPAARLPYLAHMTARSPVITSASMLHRRAQSMDVLRPFPLPPSRRDQAIAQTRIWQRELDEADAKWRNKAAPKTPKSAFSDDSDDSSVADYDLSNVWQSFVNHLEDSVSILPIDDADLQSSGSETESEPPLTPEIGYLGAPDEVLVGLGLGYLAWSRQQADQEPLKAPRRCSSMALMPSALNASRTSTMAVLADSTNTLRKSQSSGMGLAMTHEAAVKALPRKRSMVYPQLHLSQRSAKEPLIWQDEDNDETICFGRAI